MGESHSFREYVAYTFDNQFWAGAEEYLNDNLDSLDIELRQIRRAGGFEIQDVHVEHVWTDDMPGMKIQFDVAVSVTFELKEGNYRYDSSEDHTIWLMVRCRGDLDCDLKDFEIFDVSDYKGKNRAENPMDDDLVPVIYKENLDTVAEQFLRDHYKKALLEPIWVDPLEVAKNMGLTVRSVYITKDGSIFGRSYFYDRDVELYDPEKDAFYTEHIPAGTILVDKQASFMYALGTTNNTIIHECVHWDKHKKAFALARLYNEELTNIGCKVAGGVAGNKSGRNAVGWMEWQANALTPRIQMPLTMFKNRVERLISQFRRELKEYDMIDIIEPIIDQLAADFCVSRTAAKIRMIDAGYEEAAGAFIFLDGRYVKTHKAKSGYLEKNKTFSISSLDAVILSVSNQDLMRKLEEGRYQFVDSHFVLNHPMYLEMGDEGYLQLTHYARNHMDECCLVFELSVKETVEEFYYSECFLNRDKASTVDLSVAFHDGYENAPPERQRKLLLETLAEEERIYKTLTLDFHDCLKKVIDWRNDQIKAEKEKNPHADLDKITAAEIARRTDLNEATVRRAISGGEASLNTLILICLALHLPYRISRHIIDHSPSPLILSTNSRIVYNYVLQVHYGKTVEEVKKIISELGADPL